jgi:hypothetical protein
MKRNSSETKVSAEAFASKPIQDFFRKRHVEIWHASRLIGGYGAAGIVEKCAMRLESYPCFDDEVWELLERILATITFKETSHPNTPFMGAFAVLDPSDPVIEEIRALADDLRGAMDLALQRQRWASERRPAAGDASRSGG